MTVRIALTVNGHDRAFDVDADTPLLYILRNPSAAIASTA
jgi:aerobic-type carbon monoxide dehydrogenase small subunit (CoxS/CutS family)